MLSAQQLPMLSAQQLPMLSEQQLPYLQQVPIKQPPLPSSTHLTPLLLLLLRLAGPSGRVSLPHAAALLTTMQRATQPLHSTSMPRCTLSLLAQLANFLPAAAAAAVHGEGYFALNLPAN
jgi:hypothetical protein